jgi:hypothetical protein
MKVVKLSRPLANQDTTRFNQDQVLEPQLNHISITSIPLLRQFKRRARTMRENQIFKDLFLQVIKRDSTTSQLMGQMKKIRKRVLRIRSLQESIIMRMRRTIETMRGTPNLRLLLIMMKTQILAIPRVSLRHPSMRESRIRMPQVARLLIGICTR